MATWNIGIDEKGTFDCFEESDSRDSSFVCAVVTQKKEAESVSFLKQCTIAIDSKKYEECYDERKEKFLSNLIAKFFHTSDVSQNSGVDFLENSMKFVCDCKYRDVFFERVFVSPGNTDFVGSRQNYYLNSLYEVLSHIFQSGLFEKNDSINIFIAERALEVTGYVAPAHIIVDQLFAECKRRKQKGATEEDFQNINNAIEIVLKYGYKDTEKKRAEALANRYQKNLSEEFIEKNRLYDKHKKEYHEKLKKSIEKFLTSCYPSFDGRIRIECQSARKSIFPALADIAANLVKFYNLPHEIAKKRSLIKGLNVKAFIEDGNIEAAAELIGSLFYDVPDKARPNLEELFESVTSKNYDSVWKILTELCIEKMHNRGTEGDQFSKTGDLIKHLDEFIDTYKPSPIVYARYLKMKGEYAQHSGSVDLNAARALVKKIKDLRENCRDKEVYAELYDIEEEFWIESYAQVMFNSYDFNDADYKRVLEKYESNIKLLPFYSEIYTKEDFKDKRYSVIWGTLGQALAFSGNHDKAIEYLRKDYDHSNYMKFLPASFLVVEYLRKGELENAVEWFKIQVKEVVKEEKTIEHFFKDVEDDKDVDKWLVLNFLRIWAYSMKMGKPVVQRTLSFEKWTERNFDEYPGGLVLKWAAICNFYAKGSKETTIALLNKSIEVMTKDSTFTINSLALSPMRVLNVLDTMPIESYAKTYDDMCKRCESFTKYAEANPVLDPKTECRDVWDAALILPFNYA